MGDTDTPEGKVRDSNANHFSRFLRDNENPQLVVGVECDQCGASITNLTPKRPEEYSRSHTLIDHDKSCPHWRKYKYPELGHVDLSYLHRLYRMFGREKARDWVKSHVALSTSLQRKKLDGEQIDEEDYYDSAVNYYLDIGDE